MRLWIKKITDNVFKVKRTVGPGRETRTRLDPMIAVRILYG